MFTRCGTQTTQACDKHTRTWAGFEISFAEYAKEISIITHIDAEIEKPHITPLELSQLQALNGQLLWLGYAMFATVAGASVTVDGTNTASHSGHDL